jgi:ABC-type antimicrobial peptide transport system permease subunit
VSWLSAGFGIVALLLTSIGLYGVLAYTVVRRTSEFGIRMALGAGRIAILRMVMTEGLALVGIGLATGILAAAWLSRLVANLLFGVRPYDVATFAGAAVTLIVVAAAASYGPARRATTVEPVTALRYE